MYQNDYVFQVFVTKPTTRYAVNNCQPGNELLGSLVGHISELGNPVPKNPVPKNPVPKNPVPKNAPLSDVLVQNTTFTLESNETASAPGAAGYSALSATSLGCDPATGAGLIGERHSRGAARVQPGHDHRGRLPDHPEPDRALPPVR